MIHTKEELRNRIERIAEKRLIELPYETELKFNLAVNKKQLILRRLKAFWKGENELGRYVGRILDVFLLFSPKIKTGRQLAKSILINKNTMPILKDKPWYESKTIWSAIIVIVITILNAVGVDAVNDPEAMQAIYSVLYAIAGALGLFGLRDAIGDKKDG